MVQLEEVEDEEFERVQTGEQDFNDDDYTDTGMSIARFIFSLSYKP